MNRSGRIICICLGMACLALAVAVQRKPAAAVRQVASPSAKILLADPVPNEDEELLARPVSQLDVMKMPLEQVLSKLTEMDSAPITIEWDRLGELHVPHNVAVTVQVRDGCLADALHAIIWSLEDQGYHGIDFGVSERCIRIGPSGEIYRSTQTRYFNIRPLLTRLAADANSFGPSPRETPAEQVMRMISDQVDATSWREMEASSGA